jgi:hypothetical protein
MEGAVLSGKLCAKEINEMSRELKLQEDKQDTAVVTEKQTTLSGLVIA